MRWWKVALIVFLIGIVAILGAFIWKRTSHEGFQTTPTGFNVDSNEQAYLIYPTGAEGSLTKDQAMNLCKRFDGELATIGQLMDAADAGANWTEIGWTLESAFGFRLQGGNVQEMRWCPSGLPKTGWQVKTKFNTTPEQKKSTLGNLGAYSVLLQTSQTQLVDDCGQAYTKSSRSNYYDVWPPLLATVDYSSIRANAICYGVKPLNPSGYTVSAFNAANKSSLSIQPVPSSISELPILTKSSTSTTSYSIYDLSPIYTQLDISTVEFLKTRAEVYSHEDAFIQRGLSLNTADNFYYSNNEDIRRIWFSYWWNPWVDGTKWSEKSQEGFNTYIATTRDRINSLYNINLFTSHPVGYILSGEKKRPTQVNTAPIFIQNLPVGKITVEDRVNQEDFTWCERKRAYSGFFQNNKRVYAINYFIAPDQLFVPFGQIDIDNYWRMLPVMNNGKWVKYSDFSVKNPNSIQLNSKDTLNDYYFDTWWANIKHVKFWNLDTIYRYLRSSIDELDSDFQTTNYIWERSSCSVNYPWAEATSDGWGNYQHDAYPQQLWNNRLPSKLFLRLTIDSTNCPSPCPGEGRTYHLIQPSNIIKNKSYKPPEQAQISNQGIVSSTPSWTPVRQRSDGAADTIWNAFTSRKPNQADYFWKSVPIYGSMSSTNKQEIDKSISYSIYFNFSNSSLTERQIRIGSDLKLYMSPNFRAMPEYRYRITTDSNNVRNIVVEADELAQVNNRAHCAVEIPITGTGSDFLKFIPYHARRYITRWADARFGRLKGLSTLAGQLGASSTVSLYTSTVMVGDIPYQTGCPKPTFDMLTTLTTTDQFNLDKKKAVMDKIAKCYYDLIPSSEPERIMKQIYDVYQVGDTIFDVRYEVQEKVSDVFKKDITELTNKYLALRRSPLTIAQLAELERNYQDQAAVLYAKENKNISNYGERCSELYARNVRYIQIEPTTPDKLMYISQVIVSNNSGVNVAQFARVTNSTMSGALFEGEELTTSTLSFSFGGQILTPAQNANYVLEKNKANRAAKLSLVTDGVLYSRNAPNLYKSERTTNEYIRIDLGGTEQVVGVKLVIPPIDYLSTETIYKVTLRDTTNPDLAIPNSQQLISSSGTTTGSMRTTSLASYLLPPDATTNRRDANCPSDYASRFRTARFYATIEGDGKTNAVPDVSKLTFTGFSESADIIDTPALSFNPRYNCGFDLPLEEPTGNSVYTPIQSFTRNFPASQTIVNCADAISTINTITEYRISQRDDGFKGRQDVIGLLAEQQYSLETESYFPSSVHKYAQVDPSTCAYVFKELKVNTKTNQLLGVIDRYAMIRMKPDTENWFSPKILYDVSTSRMYGTETDLQGAIGLGKPLQTLASPVSVPIPLPPKVALNTGNGACPEKYCGDVDVINSLIAQYNNIKMPDGTINPNQILRVNRAATVAMNKCDYEVILGNYSGGVVSDTPTTTVVSTISLFSELDPTSCDYKLRSATVGQGFFANEQTPLLARIYTYASDVLAPIYNSLYKSISTVKDIAAEQLNTSKETIAQAFGTYRTDVLGAYGALKQLDGCAIQDTTNRCYDPSIVSQFIDTYAQRTSANDSERLRQILRAATASGTECDFTFETEALTVAGGLVTVGNKTTRGMRCRMVKDPQNCNFTIDTAPYKSEEVYLVSTVGMTLSEGAQKCASLGARMATYNELAHALRKGAQWCEDGWIADDIGMSTFTVGSCASGQPAGINRRMPQNGRANVHCIGIKPDQATLPSDTALRNFNTSNYKMPVETLGGCMPLIPTPPSAEDLADLGYQPTTAQLTASFSTMTTTSGIGQTMIRSVAADPLDFINCASDYALDSIRTTTFPTGSGAITGLFPITTAENRDAFTCVYNDRKQFRFQKDPVAGVFSADPAGYNGAPTAGLAANKVAFSRSAFPTLSLTPAITTDADCMRPAILAAIGAPVVGSGKRVDATTCEYRMSARDDLPFDATYKQFSFYGSDAAGVRIRAARRGNPATSLFKYGPRDLQAVYQTISTIAKTNWNSKYYTPVVASERQIRTSTGRVSTIGVYGDRIGKISGIAYIPTEDAYVIQARNATYGVYGETDVRSYTEAQPFKIQLRNPFAAPSKTMVYRMDKISNTAGITFTATTDPDESVRSSSAILSVGGEGFRMLRIRIQTPAISEISRINFYKLSATASASDTFTCGTTNSNITPVLTSRAYVSITDLEGNDLYLPSYLPQDNEACITPYTGTLDSKTNMSTCMLNTSLVETLNRSVYTFPKGAVDCPIGYTQSGSDCRITYDFNDVIGSICAFAPASGAKRLKLDSRQYLVINFNEIMTFNAYSILSGAGTATRLPATWSVEISMNGQPGQWVNVSSQPTTYNWGGANAIENQFRHSNIFQFGTTLRIPTTQLTGRLTTQITEAFVNPEIVSAAPQQTQERPSWLRITVLETQNPASRYTAMGALQFLTPGDEAIDPKRIQVSNFGSSRRSARDGPDALLDIGSGRIWVDYNRAPLLFRLPAARPPITGFRYAVPTTQEGLQALPKRLRVEGSWDGRSWTPIEENTRVPDGYTGLHPFCRFVKPF